MAVFSDDEDGGPILRRSARSARKSAKDSTALSDSTTADGAAAATSTPATTAAEPQQTTAGSAAAAAAFVSGCSLRWLWWSVNHDAGMQAAVVASNSTEPNNKMVLAFSGSILGLEVASFLCCILGALFFLPGDLRSSVLKVLDVNDAARVCKAAVVAALLAAWWNFQCRVAVFAPGASIELCAEVVTLVGAVAAMLALIPGSVQSTLLRLLAAISGTKHKGKVVALLRYPVKGLDFTKQPMTEAAELEPGCGLLHDRHWALKKGADTVAVSGLAEFDPSSPTAWVHKMRFAAACSEGPRLAQLRCEWVDETASLLVFAKNLYIPTDAPEDVVLLTRSSSMDDDEDDNDDEDEDGSNAGAAPEEDKEELLLTAKLNTKAGRAKTSTFFRSWLNDPELEIVTAGQAATKTVAKSADEAEAEAAARHQFSNTKQIEGSQMIHIVNVNTVAAVSNAVGVDVGWQRFRPNVLIEGMPAWSEFGWVGKTIRLGTATLRVTKRTVRCAATKVNPATAVADLDTPALLQKHFPEHGPYVGVYAIVVSGGSVADGDGIEAV